MSDRHVDRVLQVHTRYRQAGGEDEVVEAEKRLLENAGIDVRQVIFDNADLREGQVAGRRPSPRSVRGLVALSETSS